MVHNKAELFAARKQPESFKYLLLTFKDLNPQVLKRNRKAGTKNNYGSQDKKVESPPFQGGGVGSIPARSKNVKRNKITAWLLPPRAVRWKVRILEKAYG